jgi:DNA (cytosine-5)-methyltransferase 1
MKYISLFSGIGGLESTKYAPILCCEKDEACISVLEKRLGDVITHPDVSTLHPPKADVVTGGWPCQDISIAGRQKGLAGDRSGLFYQLLRIAREAKAHTIVAENVPNLIRMKGGRVFCEVLHAFEEAKFPIVAWRTINAREFGLPQERRRVFIIATKDPSIARALHRPFDHNSSTTWQTQPLCNGFYWTAGSRSICYSKGYVPTLKVGSGLSIPAPPAIHFDGCVRKVTAEETLRLQGFDPVDFQEVAEKDIYRMTGNAVAAPIGSFVMDSVETPSLNDHLNKGLNFGPSGIFQDDKFYEVIHEPTPLATNLHTYIDTNDRSPLSSRAAAGLLKRLLRSGTPCPPDLKSLLFELSEERVAEINAVIPKTYDLPAGQDTTSEVHEESLQYKLF